MLEAELQSNITRSRIERWILGGSEECVVLRSESPKGFASFFLAMAGDLLPQPELVTMRRLPNGKSIVWYKPKSQNQ